VKDDRIYLLHIRDAIDRIHAYTAGGRADFFGDPKTQDAVVRNIEIIGEAVKNVSAELKQARPDVSWKRIAGMRDKVIHEYFGVNLDLVWAAVQQSLPPLRAAVEEVLMRLGGSAPNAG
jgi:uncharacterized protein with HEPN domain